MNQFVLANVLHRPLRALVSVLAISLEVLLILMVVGICQGMIVETAQRQNGIGADIFLRPPNASVIFSTASDRMPTEDGEKLRIETTDMERAETIIGLMTGNVCLADLEP